MEPEYGKLPVMLWTACYAVGSLRQHTSPVPNLDRQMVLLEILASAEVADAASDYLYGV